MFFAIYEQVRYAAPTHAPSARRVDLFLPEMAAPISIQARRRALRCCQLLDGHPEGDARCKAQYHFQRRAAVAGAARFSPVASPARTTRGERLKDRHFSLQPRSERAWKHPLPRLFA